MTSFKVGIQLQPQATSVAALLDAAVAAEGAGLDSVWTWDHFYPLYGDPAANHFEGMTFGVGDGSLRHPRHWRHLWNPFRPSWGEPYVEQVARMRAAVADARDKAAGREALLVSHQLPVWLTRLSYENRRLWHDPRKRECALASLTSLRFDDDRLVGIHYSEPVADLLPGASQVAGA